MIGSLWLRDNRKSFGFDFLTLLCGSLGFGFWVQLTFGPHSSQAAQACGAAAMPFKFPELGRPLSG